MDPVVAAPLSPMVAIAAFMSNRLPLGFVASGLHAPRIGPF
ncbi:MAG: hypothetical protein ABWZ16_09710 [Microbacterium sp.]